MDEYLQMTRNRKKNSSRKNGFLPSAETLPEKVTLPSSKMTTTRISKLPLVREVAHILVIAIFTAICFFVSEHFYLTQTPKIPNRSLPLRTHAYRGGVAVSSSYDCSIIMRRCLMLLIYLHREKNYTNTAVRECTAMGILCQQATRPSFFDTKLKRRKFAITTISEQHLNLEAKHCSVLTVEQLNSMVFGDLSKTAEILLPLADKKFSLEPEEFVLKFYNRSNDLRVLRTKDIHTLHVTNMPVEALAKAAHVNATPVKDLQCTEIKEPLSKARIVDGSERIVTCQGDQRACQLTQMAIDFGVEFYEKFGVSFENSSKAVQSAAVFGMLYAIKALFDQNVTHTTQQYLTSPMELWDLNYTFTGAEDSVAMSTMAGSYPPVPNPPKRNELRPDRRDGNVTHFTFFIQSESGPQFITMGGITKTVHLAAIMTYRSKTGQQKLGHFLLKGLSDRIFQKNVVMSIYYLTQNNYSPSVACRFPDFVLEKAMPICPVFDALVAAARSIPELSKLKKTSRKCFELDDDQLVPMVFSSSAIVELERATRRFNTVHDRRNGNTNYVLGF